MSRSKASHRNRSKLEGRFQDGLDGLTRSDKDHHVTGMRVHNSTGIREFLIQPEMHFCFAGNLSVAIEFVTRQVTDQNLIWLELPMPPAATVTGCDTDQISHPNA